MAADVVIRGGTVVDGTGSRGRRADVAIAGDRITAIGDAVDADGARELDASGMVVTPGFVDVHTHYDAQVFWDPALTPSCWHGVTTVVAGNCGFSLAPCRPEHRGLMARTLEHVEDMSLAALEAGLPWDWETFGQYLDAVERRGTVLNYACYVGHTAVRLWVMGDDGYDREATSDEIARMAAVVRDALDAGAAGFATSLSPTHAGDAGRPVPSRLASTEEMETLIRVLGDAGKGVVEIIPGPALTHQRLYELQREVGVPMTWTALLTMKGTPWAASMAELNTAERAKGSDVWPQVSCRPLTFQFNLREPFTFQVVPIFGEILALPASERAARYADASWRARAQDELDHGRFLRPRWHLVSVAESPTHPELIGRPLSEVAAERGCSPLDVMVEVALAENLDTRFRQVVANDDDELIAELLRTDGMMLGLADSGAHVSQLCDACLPTDLLGNWVRDRGALSLERAIHKLTAEPAGVFGLRDRGVLAEGMKADVVVLDPDTVAPGPLRRVRDFPAGAERLVADAPEGIAHVVVNGSVIHADGKPLAEAVEQRPGALLRS
jgi:N-acyl-D-aspartate/D-glutamate deacylase